MPPTSISLPPDLSRVWAEIDLDAVIHNVRAIRGTLKHGADLMAVVKANAYGHGAAPVARAALFAGAKRLGVVKVSEGLELRAAGIDAPIQLLGPVMPQEYSPGIEADLTFSVSSEDELAALAEKTRALNQGLRRGRRTKVHLLVDTGMGRGGFAPDELWPATARVKAERTLMLEGVFTHFSSAEELDPEPTREQVRLFRSILQRLEAQLGTRLLRHAANSAATVFFPEAQLDLCRCGLLLHGLRGWAAERDGLELRPSLSLKARVVHVGMRPVGWTVGYNRTFRCARETMLATVSMGYSDGYRRALSGRSECIIRGRRVPVVGTVSMDYLVADVTALQYANETPDLGEEVILLGAAKSGERISVEDLASSSGTIPYVITTQLGPNVERRYVGGPPLKNMLTDGMAVELRRVEWPKLETQPIAAQKKEEDPPQRIAQGA